MLHHWQKDSLGNSFLLYHQERDALRVNLVASCRGHIVLLMYAQDSLLWLSRFSLLHQLSAGVLSHLYWGRGTCCNTIQLNINSQFLVFHQQYVPIPCECDWLVCQIAKSLHHKWQKLHLKRLYQPAKIPLEYILDVQRIPLE